MPPDEKNAIDSQMAASPTFTELNTVAFGFLACSRPNRTASNSIAGSTPNASESRRSGKPRKPNSSPSAAKIRPMMSGSAIRGHRLQSPVNWMGAPRQDGDEDHQLEQVAQQKRPGPQLRGGRHVARENGELREATKVDEQQTGQD